MDRMRAALDEAIERVKAALQGEPKSPVELLLDQHLPLRDEVVLFSPKNCSGVAIPTFVLTDLASRTNNIVDYPFILRRIWEVLIECQHDPSLLRKALNLLHYLLINGSIQVLKDCQDPVRTQFFDALASDYNRVEFEQYKFSKDLDVGAGVRKTAGEIYHLILHERELFHARRRAEKLHQSLSDRGLRSAYPSPRGEGGVIAPERRSVAGISFQDEARPPKYTDSLPTGPMWEDIGSKIVTHAGTVLDDLNRSSSDSRHNSRINLISSSRASSGRHDSRTNSNSSSSSSSSSSSTSRRDPPPAPSLTTTSVDLLGLDTLMSPASASEQTLNQQQQHPHGAPGGAKGRTQSYQKLVATV
ncbi:Epsin-like protein [Globisporangium polare]